MWDSPENRHAIFMCGGEPWLMNYCWSTPFKVLGVLFLGAVMVPQGGGTAGQGAHLLRRMRAEHLQPRARSTPLTPLLRYAHPWCTQIDACVRGHLRRIPYAFHVQISPKLVVPPVEGVAGEQLEWQSLSFGPFDHLQAQRDLGPTGGTLRYDAIVSISSANKGLGS